VKILLACQQSPHTYAIPAYGFWRTYFVAGLREAGHEVIEATDVDWAHGLLPLTSEKRGCWRDGAWSRTLALARDTRGIDLFLGYLYPQQIEPAAVRLLHDMGIPTVHFFCDHVREYRRLPQTFAPFDLHWVPELAAMPLYAARDWPALFAPMPCWVPPASRMVPDDDQPAITFVGRNDPLRAALLTQVVHSGLPLAVYGAGWAPNASVPVPAPPSWRTRIADWADYYRRQGPGPTWRRLAARYHRRVPLPATDFTPWAHPSPSDDAYATVLAHSAVTLGINRFPDPDASPALPSTYSRLRDIEAPMLGACYLTEWAPELEELYELGTEIEVYRDAPELVSKARSLLDDPGRRRALRVAGQRRALADHNLGCTVTRLAKFLGL